MRLSWIILLIIVIADFNYSQSNNDLPVAIVGNEKITIKEFKTRYELSPYIPGNSNLDTDSLKLDFLYSLIIGKLWAGEAEDLGYEYSDNFQFYFQPLEDLFIRDALYKTEILDKVKISDNDLKNGISKFGMTLEVGFFTSNDSSALSDFYNQLKRTVDYDSIITLKSDSVIKFEKGEIIFGKLKDENLENDIFNLDVNEYTPPFKYDAGWAIIKLENRINKPIDLNDQKIINDIKNAIRNRRIEKKYFEYIKEIFGTINIKVDEKSISLLANEIINQLNKKSFNTETDSLKIKSISFDDNDFISIRKELGKDNLNLELFSYKNNKATIFSFLAYIAFNGLSFNQNDSIYIIHKLNSELKEFIRQQVLTIEGIISGQTNSKEYLNDVQMWKEDYLAQMLKNSYLDSLKVTEEELYNFYSKDFVSAKNIQLINLLIVTVNNLEEISGIINRIQNGKSFKVIAQEYGKTDILVNSNGETGLKPFFLFDEIGRIALNLNKNEIYGPIKHNNGYSIFQLIEKKEMNDSMQIPFKQIKDRIRSQIKNQKFNDILTRKSLEFIKKRPVKIFENTLKEIDVTKIQMFVQRYMGFGGKIAGVPLTSRSSDWILEFREKANLLP